MSLGLIFACNIERYDLMKLKYISWLPAAILMIAIFYFSSKPADASNESSLPIAESILNIYENITGRSYQEADRSELLNTINHLVRKGAHFCEYAVFAMAIALHLHTLKLKRKGLFWLSVIITSLYAASDEVHQTFVPGRSGQISDVLLDTAGAFTGALFFMLVVKLVTYRKHKLKKEKA